MSGTDKASDHKAACRRRLQGAANRLAVFFRPIVFIFGMLILQSLHTPLVPQDE
jgi:hypothetical protein